MDKCHIWDNRSVLQKTDLIIRCQPRAFRQGDVVCHFQDLGRNFVQNLNFPICPIHLNFSLSSQ